MNKFWRIIFNASPVVLMVALIPIIKNDYLLTGVYILILVTSLFMKRMKKELLIFIMGFISVIFFETIFIRTGVETFIRNSLFGIMPLWLPFLWGYGFIAIKRGVQILEK